MTWLLADKVALGPAGCWLPLSSLALLVPPDSTRGRCPRLGPEPRVLADLGGVGSAPGEFQLFLLHVQSGLLAHANCARG